MAEFDKDADGPTLACPTCNSPTALGPYCGNPVKLHCISCGGKYEIKIEINQLKPGKIIFDPVDHAEAVRKRTHV